MVKIGFDPAKNAANMASRGLPFELVEQLDWAHALMEEDTRKAYGERRFQVLGFIGGGCTPLYLRRAKARCMSSVCARPIRERSRDMPKRPNPEQIDPDNPEWTDADFARARPASEVLPELFGTQAAQTMLKPRGRPRSEVVKERITIRFDADVLEAFRSTGKGWQTRMNDAMRDWVRAHSPV